jgi:RNA polymerase-binding transcription factor DksA
MTTVGHTAVGDHRRGNCEGDAFRTELERERLFRVEQLETLAGDVSAGADGLLDEVASALMTAATAALRDVDKALERTRPGRFGLRQRCGRQLPVNGWKHCLWPACACRASMQMR